MNQLLFNDYMITQAFQDMFSTCFRSKSKYFDLKKEVTEKKKHYSFCTFLLSPISLKHKKNVSYFSLAFLSASPFLSSPWMATHGAAQPSTKKRSFLLRDFFKLFRAISRVLPREKSNHIHKASKHERKLRTKSKDHEEQIFNVSDDPNAFRFQVMILKFHKYNITVSKFWVDECNIFLDL